jgi:hypothetical protein
MSLIHGCVDGYIGGGRILTDDDHMNRTTTHSRALRCFRVRSNTNSRLPLSNASTYNSSFLMLMNQHLINSNTAWFAHKKQNTPIFNSVATKHN